MASEKSPYDASNDFTTFLPVDLEILMGAGSAHSRAGQRNSGRSRMTELKRSRAETPTIIQA